MLLPGNKVWGASTWIERGLFEDCARLSGDDNPLRDEFELGLNANAYTIDFRERRDLILPFAELVARVIEHASPDTFDDPDWFPVYLGKLRELESLLRECA